MHLIINLYTNSIYSLWNCYWRVITNLYFNFGYKKDNQLNNNNENNNNENNNNENNNENNNLICKNIKNQFIFTKYYISNIIF